MKYCCDSFSRLVENAGQKGVGVVHAVYLGERQFMLQSRPFEPDVYEYHSKVDPATGKTAWPSFRNGNGDIRGMAVLTHQLIRFCPLCGRSLKSLIELNTDEFDKLVTEQRRLLNG